MRAILFLLPAFLIACNGEQNQSGEAAAESEPGANIELRHVTGDDLVAEIRAMDKDAVVLNVWATWCAPCIEEFPDFVRFSNQGDDNVAVRFVSVDSEGDETRALQFLDRKGVTGVSYFRTGDDQAFLRAIHPSISPGIPITFIFDREGEIQDSWMGVTTFDQLRARVRRVVNAQTS